VTAAKTVLKPQKTFFSLKSFKLIEILGHAQIHAL